MAQEYDHYMASCVNGVVHYYGVTVDENCNETSVDIGRRGWEDAGFTITPSCPIPAFQIIQYPSQALKGNSKEQMGLNQSYGAKMGLSASVIQQYQSLSRYKQTLLMVLRAAGVIPKSRNNIYEIAALYYRAIMGGKLSLDQLRVATFPTNTTIQREAKTMEKSGWGDIFGDIVGGIGQAVEAGNQAQAQQTANTWATNFTHYLNDLDFPAIRDVWTKEGPKAGLAKFNDYKNGSWAEMKADITRLCTSANIPIPAPYTQGWAAQDKLESDLNAALSNAGGQQTGGGGNSNDYNNTSTPSGGGNKTGGFSTFWAGNKSWLVPVLIIAAIAIAMGVFSNKRRKKAASE